MINSREECAEFVANCRYAPAGHRSFGPIRANWYAGMDYWKYANDTVLTFAMIETQKALDNLDEILTTPGLDAIYVGPADLGLSLGFQPTGDPAEPKVKDAIKTILKAAQRHKIPAGIHCMSPAYAKEMIGLGYQLVTLASDNALLATIARNTVAQMREGGGVKPGAAGMY